MSFLYQDVLFCWRRIFSRNLLINVFLLSGRCFKLGRYNSLPRIHQVKYVESWFNSVLIRLKMTWQMIYVQSFTLNQSSSLRFCNPRLLEQLNENESPEEIRPERSAESMGRKLDYSNLLYANPWKRSPDSSKLWFVEKKIQPRLTKKSFSTMQMRRM